MAKQTINIGSGELSGDGETLRSAFNKTNQNFTEVYNSLTNISTASYSSITNTNISNWNTAYGWGDHATEGYLTSTISTSLIPSADVTYDLGSTSSQWRSLYVGGTIYQNGTPVSGGAATTSTLYNGTYTLQLLVGGGQPYVVFPPAYGTQLAIQGNEIASQDTSTLVLSAGGSGIGNVHINTYNPTPNTWVFGNDAVLAFPSGSAIGPEGMGASGLSNGDSGNPVYIVNKKTDGNYLSNILLTAGDGISGEITFEIWNTVTSTAKSISINTACNIVLANGVVLKDTAGSSIGLGYNAGQNNQGVASIAIGTNAGENTQSGAAVAIGFRAGRNTQGQGATAVGSNAGATNQRNDAVSVGNFAGYINQSTSSVAIGSNAGYQDQGLESVAIGKNAGNTGQKTLSVAVGNQAGEIGQGLQSTAVGSGAGNYNQGTGTVAIGSVAGSYNQGLRAVAVGVLAGSQNQGEYAVALGNFAGGTNQPANSIVINASGIALNGSAAGLFIDPVRADSSANTSTTFLYYNPVTKEITTSSSSIIRFPDGTTSTGASVYVPYATSSSFQINLQTPPGFGGVYIPYEFSLARLKLPSGNGGIQSGTYGDLWFLDSANTTFQFPNVSRINYGDGGYLSTGTLQVDVRDGGIFQITLNDSNKTWTFNNSGNIVFPDGTTQTTAYVSGVIGGYIPSNTGNWIGTPTVATVSAALDELAQRTTTVESIAGVTGTNVTNVFMYNSNASYSMTQNVEYKIPFDTVSTGHDNGDFQTTSSQFIPQIAGWYLLETHLNFGGVWSGNVNVSVYKNNNQEKLIGTSWVGNGGGVGGSAFVYSNGTTDIFEIRATQTSGGVQALEHGATKTWFQATWMKS